MAKVGNKSVTEKGKVKTCYKCGKNDTTVVMSQHVKSNGKVLWANLCKDMKCYCNDPIN